MIEKISFIFKAVKKLVEPTNCLKICMSHNLTLYTLHWYLIFALRVIHYIIAKNKNCSLLLFLI